MIIERPIPDASFPTGDAGSAFTSGELICADEYFGGSIIIENVYYKSGIEGTDKKCYIQKDAAHMLEAALKLLPHGLTFKIFDAWRSVKTQQSLYNGYYAEIKNKNVRLTEAEVMEITKKFVSQPSFNEEKPSAHNTGGAVDLTLFDLSENRDVNMGTAFDDFTEKAYTSYFEHNCLSVADAEIQNNRRLLYHCMTAAGFTNLPSEWWHYDYGDCFWSYYTQKPMIFKGIIR